MDETETCASLLQEIQIMWDEIGESDYERDKMLLEIEDECLKVYQRKAGQTKHRKDELLKKLQDFESEIAEIASTIGESLTFKRVTGPLIVQLKAMQPILEDLRSKQKERVENLGCVRAKINSIKADILGEECKLKCDQNADESDLTIPKLEELKIQLKELQIEKDRRLKKVEDDITVINELSRSMALDVDIILINIHPSLSANSGNLARSISNHTLASLSQEIRCLNEQKKEKLNKLQEYGRKLIELWNLMDEPIEERRKWDHVISSVSLSVNDIQIYGSLSSSLIEEAEREVARLNVLKTSRIRELLLKKQSELEEVFKETNMEIDESFSQKALTDYISSGDLDPCDMLGIMDDKIEKAKELALSRRDVLEKMEKWKLAAEEENWLDNYEKDENRYSAGRGAHKNLKRAEKARVLSGKIPSLVDALAERVKAWESDKGIPFLIGKVPLSNLLEEYNLTRKERIEEKRRLREQKRMKDQFEIEQETIYGSRPKKPLGLNNSMAATPGRRLTTPLSQRGVSTGKERRESKAHSFRPINFVALCKEDFPARNP